MFKRRECLVPTLRGWIVLLLLAAALFALVVGEAHSFLTVNDPVSSDMLVIEGWVPDDMLQGVIAEVARGRYHKVLVTGGPLGSGRILCGYTTWAELGAATLHQLGVSTNVAEAVVATRVVKDRTYTSALALRVWLRRHQIESTSLNVLTIAEHSRRTRLLFCKALGPDYHVGIISVADPDYDAKRWWRSSAGVRSVISELIAYGYARFLFWPPAQVS
jgi:hypothetical protein